MIEITYTVTDLSDGFKQYQRTLSVPNYRTLRSLLSAVDAACMDIELEVKGASYEEQAGNP